MRIYFRMITKKKFPFLAEPTDSIGDLKRKLAEEEEWDVRTLHMKYKKKTVLDYMLLSVLGIQERGIIDLMIVPLDVDGSKFDGEIYDYPGEKPEDSETLTPTPASE